jgi:hypothetical protein
MSGTKRTRIDRQHRAGAVTPQVIHLHRRVLELQRKGASREDIHDAERLVERTLGVKLWDFSPYDFPLIFKTDEPPAYVHEKGPGAVANWQHAKDLR